MAFVSKNQYYWLADHSPHQSGCTHILLFLAVPLSCERFRYVARTAFASLTDYRLVAATITRYVAVIIFLEPMF